MPDRRIEFERQIMPHLSAANDLARWLMRHPHDAEDVVQEAFLKAFRAFDQFSGGNAKAWILAVVRNVAMTRLGRARAHGKVVVLQDVIDEIEDGVGEGSPEPLPRPDEALIALDDRQRVHRALASLPQPLREILVLREFDDLSYQEIAEVIGAPVGTVMSRLSRARERMRRALGDVNESTDGDMRRKKDHD